MSRYDVIIIGAGPGGIFAAYELAKKAPELKVAVFESGNSLEKRKCPIDGKKIKSCINCKTCAIMSGFGGAGAFSDGKYNITNDFGGTLYEYIGKDTAIDLMKYVDEINLAYGGEGTKMYSTAGTDIKKLCIQNELKLLDASVRHLGTDINYIVLENLYKELKEKVEFRFNYRVDELEAVDGGYRVISGDSTDECEECIISVGRSGSKWMEKVCESLDIETNSNRVDLGVRVELPAVIFSHLTDELYESKIVYRTEKFEDKVRTFCMNPYGIVVNENTNGIVTVNGHSYEDPKKQTENTNFALLVAKHFSEPFKDSNGYGESIARLSNMLGGGVIVHPMLVPSSSACTLSVKPESIIAAGTLLIIWLASAETSTSRPSIMPPMKDEIEPICLRLPTKTKKQMNVTSKLASRLIKTRRSRTRHAAATAAQQSCHEMAWPTHAMQSAKSIW